MNDLEMWSLLVGSLMPTLVAVIQQPRFSNAQRALVGVGASLVAGFMTTWVAQDDALWEQPMVTSILLVAIASWSSYKAFWKPTAVAPFVESKTTVLKSG